MQNCSVLVKEKCSSPCCERAALCFIVCACGSCQCTHPSLWYKLSHGAIVHICVGLRKSKKHKLALKEDGQPRSNRGQSILNNSYCMSQAPKTLDPTFPIMQPNSVSSWYCRKCFSNFISQYDPDEITMKPSRLFSQTWQCSSQSDFTLQDNKEREVLTKPASVDIWLTTPLVSLHYSS